MEADSWVRISQQVHKQALTTSLLKGCFVEATSKNEQQENCRTDVPGPQSSMHALYTPFVSPKQLVQEQQIRPGVNCKDTAVLSGQTLHLLLIRPLVDFERPPAVS